eukprot:GHRR01016454.1.p1 GENE.GHRR01016454.1~~GHRR01016454.1.p1  ORF type:complete len:236 (+),score=52.74 GHRR01016454.1:114-821(+)
MAELITEDQPRIKFELEFQGSCSVPAAADLQELCRLMERMERLGAAPILNDGKIGGNCGLLLDANVDGQALPCLFVSRSGKAPQYHLQPSDFVQVTAFDKRRWRASYKSEHPDYKPTSDTPLLHACLSCDGQHRHHWQQPRVALHGHALAEGEGLATARELGLPISEHETLFSTPADLQALEKLLSQHPYPRQRCFIRRSHGFFILAQSCKEAEQVLDELVVPFLLKQQQQQQPH